MFSALQQPSEIEHSIIAVAKIVGIAEIALIAIVAFALLFFKLSLFVAGEYYEVRFFLLAKKAELHERESHVQRNHLSAPAESQK